MVCTCSCTEGQGHVTFPSYLIWFFVEEPHDILSSEPWSGSAWERLCRCVRSHSCAERSWSWDFHNHFSILHAFVLFWDTISHWTWSSSIWVDWLVSKSQGSSCPHLPRLGYRCMLVSDVDLCSGSRILVLFLLFCALYLWSHPPSPLNVFGTDCHKVFHRFFPPNPVFSYSNTTDANFLYWKFPGKFI